MSIRTFYFTSESVSEGHPDKVCDRISDEIVDLYFRESTRAGVDPSLVRVAAETLATTNQLVIAGETRGADSITKDMIEGMKPGSVIVDLAVDTGGNVAGAKLDEEVNVGGVRVIGIGNPPGRVALDASQMFSSNLVNFITDYWDKESKTFNLDLEDEIIRGCLITHQKQIVNETIRNHYKA